MLSNIDSTSRTIQSRQESNRGGLSAGDDFLGDKKMWAKTFGSRADQDNRNGISGYGANSYGLIVGTDGELSSRNRLGVAFAYNRSDVDSNSTVAPSNTKVNSYQLVVYGSHALDARTEFSYQVDAGQHQTKGSRSINFGGLQAVARSDYDSQSGHLGLGLARTYALSGKTTLTPNVRLDYTWMRDAAYRETGANALNLDVAKRDTEQLIVSLGGKLLHPLSEATTLASNLGIGYDTMAKASSITSAYVGGGAAFQTKGIKPGATVINGGLGLTVKARSGLEAGLRYDIEAREGFTNQTVSAKLNWAF